MRNNQTLLMAVGSAAALFLAVGLPQVATAQETCSFEFSFLEFPAYLRSDTADTLASVELVVGCNQEIQVASSAGQNSAMDFTKRAMGGNSTGNFGELLFYNLYVDEGLSIIWGDGSDATELLKRESVEAPFRAFAKIPAKQQVPAGRYDDFVEMVVEM